MLIARSLLLACLTLLAKFTVVLGQDNPLTPNQNRTFRVAGYLPDYRMAEYDFAKASSLSDLILFSAEPKPDGSVDLSRLNNAPWQRIKEVKTRYRLRLILCVGGWERSTHFPQIASSRELRTKFAKNLVELCLQNRLDGIDIDWEHPANTDAEKNYALLLQEVKNEFKPHGLTLTLTMAGWQSLPPDAFLHVDWVNLMAYDHQGQHSTFEGMKSEVEKLLKAGCPADKLVVGLPLYGRKITKPADALSYAELLAKHKLRADQNEVDGFFLNGPELIAAKTEFALQKRLGGVMVWELGHDADAPNSLVELIRATVDKF